MTSSTSNATRILTPDQRPRVFISSTLQELASERAAARTAIDALRLIPVMFELGARPHPARALYRAYLAQSHVFVGVYYERYGWVAPGEQVSGLEDEYLLSGTLPRLVYLKAPAPGREPRLSELVDRIRDDDSVAYKTFSTADELAALLRDDLAVLLGERFLLDDAGTAYEAAHPSTAAVSLPHPVSSLLGRDSEIEGLADLLSAGTRLVTVVGPGGIGKTRVALAVAERWAADDPGAVAFVPLESVDDPADVLPAIASAIGLGLDRGVPALDALAGAFGSRPYLLLLDNVEQVLESAADIAALLSRCPGVAVLATSRAPLRLRGERLAPLGPLNLPDDDAVASVQASAAAQLFVERARAVDPDFSLDDPADAAAVAELCRRLDGLPLAVEIAAARSRVLPPRALLARISSALDIGAGAADLPARQRTIRDTLAWSEQLLTQDQRDLLARLAVFAAPWTLADAEAVARSQGQRHEPGDVLEDVAGLVEHSLVSPAASAPSEPRFWMFESVRVYACERLSAEDRQAADAAYVARMAERVVPLASLIRSPDHARWRAELRAIWPDLRRAWEIAVRQGDTAAASQLVLSVGALWLVGRSNEARSLVAATIDLASEGTPREQTQIVLSAAIWAFSVGEFEWTNHLLDRLGADVPAPDDPADAGGADLLRGYMFAVSGDLARCESTLQGAVTLLQGSTSPGARWLEGFARNGIGSSMMSRGADDDAIREFTESRALSHQQGNVAAEMLALVFLAGMRLTCGLPDESVALLLEATDLMEAEPYYEGNAYCLEVAAALAITRGDVTGATEALGLAQTLREVSGARVWALIARMSEGVREAAGARLGPEAFDAACARGRSMDPRAAAEVVRTLVHAH